MAFIKVPKLCLSVCQPTGAEMPAFSSAGLTVSICRGLWQDEATGIRSDFGKPAYRANRNGRTEDLQIVMVDLIFQPGFPDLIQPLELIQID